MCVDDETMNLLRDARDYLWSLPRHPMTRELAQRIDAHLDNPSVLRTAAVVQKADQLAARRVVRMSNVWGLTAEGIPSLVVSLTGDEVEIQSPRSALLSGTSSGKQFAIQLAKSLAPGIRFHLDPGPFWALPNLGRPDDSRTANAGVNPHVG